MTRSYSKRAMEKYFSIGSVNEQFIRNAQKIKDRGLTCCINKFAEPLTIDKLMEREETYRQEVDNLLYCAILVRDHLAASIASSVICAPAAKTKAIIKRNKWENWVALFQLGIEKSILTGVVPSFFYHILLLCIYCTYSEHNLNNYWLHLHTTSLYLITVYKLLIHHHSHLIIFNVFGF